MPGDRDLWRLTIADFSRRKLKLVRDCGSSLSAFGGIGAGGGKIAARRIASTLSTGRSGNAPQPNRSARFSAYFGPQLARPRSPVNHTRAFKNLSSSVGDSVPLRHPTPQPNSQGDTQLSPGNRPDTVLPRGFFCAATMGRAWWARRRAKGVSSASTGCRHAVAYTLASYVPRADSCTAAKSAGRGRDAHY
jgi:hypothetical protein